MLDKILAGISVAILIIVVSFIAYNNYSEQEVKVVVEFKEGQDPLMTGRQIVPNDSALTDIRKMSDEDNVYELSIKTKRKRSNLLDFLKSSSQVERIDSILK